MNLLIVREKKHITNTQRKQLAKQEKKERKNQRVREKIKEVCFRRQNR